MLIEAAKWEVGGPAEDEQLQLSLPVGGEQRNLSSQRLSSLLITRRPATHCNISSLQKVLYQQVVQI